MSLIDSPATVMVTGATGYIASWVVKYLLDTGHKVHASVRSLGNTENLTKLAEKAPGTLHLFEADLLQEGTFDEAAKRCDIIIHTASPFLLNGVKNAQKQLVDPAVNGTKNVLSAANSSGSVKRVVLTSSVVAIYGDAADIEQTSKGIFTEEHWNTTSSLSHQPYAFSKVQAEKAAWEIAKAQQNWDMVVINPGFVMGPSLSQRKDSASVSFMLDLAGGRFKSGVPDLTFGVVDVRDVAMAHLRAAFNEDADGRFILSGTEKSFLEMGQMLDKNYGSKYSFPKSNLPKFIFYLVGPFMGFSWKYTSRNVGILMKFDSSRSKSILDIKYRDIEQTLTDHLEQLVATGMLEKG